MSKRTQLRDTLYNYSNHSQIAPLIAAREEERKKIARELHDSVGQELTVVALEINRVLSNCRELADNAVIRDACGTLQHAYDRISDLTVQVGQLSHLLHPSTLQQTGLRAALKRLCEEVRSLTGMQIDCECPALSQMSFDVGLCIYRIAQEALHNVSKHARASSVQVIVSEAPSAIAFRIRDNGCGFDPSAPQICRGIGLTSMAERVRSLGGQFLITTKIGSGTEIFARVPTKA